MTDLTGSPGSAMIHGTTDDQGTSDPGAKGDDETSSEAATCASPDLREGNRVDVVVDDDRDPENTPDPPRDVHASPADQGLRGRSHDASPWIHDAGRANAHGCDVSAQLIGALHFPRCEAADGSNDCIGGGGLGCPCCRGVVDPTIPADEPSRKLRAPDVDTDGKCGERAGRGMNHRRPFYSFRANLTN
jgi:hypothetical protein